MVVVRRLATLFLLSFGIAFSQALPSGTDLTGHSVPLAGSRASHAVVVFFLASDCPISNRTLPEMKRVQAEFSERGVAFWFVYPNSTETGRGIRDHAAAFRMGDKLLTDPHGRLAHFTGAKWTPEAVVLAQGKAGWNTVYRGRIDDRYLGIGKERPEATRHNLEEAVTAVLDGRAPNPPGGPTVGCGIVGAP